MNRSPSTLVTAAAFFALALTTGAWAQPPKMQMTTEVPPGIATPDRLETRLGTLTLKDGVPDQETARTLYDNLSKCNADRQP